MFDWLCQLQIYLFLLFFIILELALLPAGLMLGFINRRTLQDHSRRKGLPCLVSAWMPANQHPAGPEARASHLGSLQPTSSRLYSSADFLTTLGLHIPVVPTPSLKVWVSVLRAGGSFPQFLVPSWCILQKKKKKVVAFCIC